MKTSDQHSSSAAHRQELEARLIDAMDGQLNPAALRQLETALQSFPELREEARLLGIRFDAVSAVKPGHQKPLHAAFPIYQPEESKLKPVRASLHNTARLPETMNANHEAVFEQQVYQWFPAYISAAALILLALLGVYNSGIPADDTMINDESLHEWIYAADLQQAFSEEAMLADEVSYDQLFPPDENDTPILTEPSDEN